MNMASFLQNCTFSNKSPKITLNNIYYLLNIHDIKAFSLKTPLKSNKSLKYRLKLRYRWQYLGPRCLKWIRDIDESGHSPATKKEKPGKR